MRSFRTLAMALGAAAMLAACDGSPTGSREPERAAAPDQATLDAQFAAAGREFDVPVPLLKAVAYAKTGWIMVAGGSAEAEGGGPFWGMMALTDEQVARGARLARVSVRAAQNEPEANVRAGAALLRQHADRLGIDRADLNAWAPAVAAWSGYPQPEVQAAFVRNGVYAVLREGVDPRGLPLQAARVTMDLVPGARPHLPALSTAPTTAMAVGSAVATEWVGGLFGSRGTATIDILALHSCNPADIDGCVSTMKQREVSSHYVVSNDGRRVAQMVGEENAAWHIGASYDARDGKGYIATNPRSIGIEHGGGPWNDWLPTREDPARRWYGAWSAAKLDKSVQLSCDILKRNVRIPRDRQHIIGHYQADSRPEKQVDPGAGFPWVDFMNRVASCADSEIVTQMGTGYCLDVPWKDADGDGKMDNSTGLVMNPCYNNAHQAIRFVGDELRLFGKCIDAGSGNMQYLVQVTVYDCHGQTQQKWFINSLGQLQIRGFTDAYGRGACMDVAYANRNPGAPVVLQYCHPTVTNQRWWKRD